MNILEDTICRQCNQKVINCPNQFCRRQFLPHKPRGITKFSKLFKTNLFKTKFKLFRNGLRKNELTTSGNFKLDEFIKETQLNSKYCDDFIEWIPHLNLKNIKYLTDGGNSKVYFGTWNLSINTVLTSKQLSTNVALKVIKDSDNIDDIILNEVRKAASHIYFYINRSCFSLLVFYG
jgi:hypothetical protein